jgi:hypothetical protein
VLRDLAQCRRLEGSVVRFATRSPVNVCRNSAWDRWRYNRDKGAVSDLVKQATRCSTARRRAASATLGNNFTDSQFHNIGVGWDP